VGVGITSCVCRSSRVTYPARGLPPFQRPGHVGVREPTLGRRKRTHVPGRERTGGVRRKVDLPYRRSERYGK